MFKDFECQRKVLYEKDGLRIMISSFNDELKAVTVYEDLYGHILNEGSFIIEKNKLY